MRTGKAKLALILVLVLVLTGGAITLIRSAGDVHHRNATAYFDNSNGIYVGDDVDILGVRVGQITKIEPQPDRVKISFWYDDKHPVPADVKAVILSPSLVTIRAIQLVPAYTTGPVMGDDAVIPRERTAVPVEFDQLRQQLEKLTQTLQPTQPGGVSTLGALVDTAADNLRGQGASIRDTILKLSEAISALGDHSGDLFTTVKNLSTLVSALHDSAGALKNLNRNLAAVTGLLADDPNKVGKALEDLNEVVEDAKGFVAQNREALGTTSDKLASVTTAVVQSLDDLKQTLHIAPTAFQNFLNIYAPAQGTLTGALAFGNFANPVEFLCSAVQAASKLGAEQSSKLCVQYLAPIMKNRQFNYPPLGENLFNTALARPNEVTYSEDWLRPDYIPPPGPNDAPAPVEAPTAPADSAPALAAEAPAPPGAAPPPTDVPPQPTNPADGLPGMMAPLGGGR